MVNEPVKSNEKLWRNHARELQKLGSRKEEYVRLLSNLNEENLRAQSAAGDGVSSQPLLILPTERVY